INAVFAAVYGYKDVVVVERTRGRKSLIFYTFSILTRLVALQIILLNRLEEEQASNIRRALS
ncbi:uncharacterized protein SEPMUDRAFT_32438, partial [Sphaerulina musiva SO2202]